MGRECCPGMEAAGPEDSPSDCSKEEETISNRPSAASVQRSRRRTANGISDHSQDTLSAEQSPSCEWGARSKGCPGASPHLSLCSNQQYWSSRGAGAAGQPVWLCVVMEQLLRCCRLTHWVERSIAKQFSPAHLPSC